jgi:hypothetical protein
MSDVGDSCCAAVRIASNFFPIARRFSASGMSEGLANPFRNRYVARASGALDIPIFRILETHLASA